MRGQPGDGEHAPAAATVPLTVPPRSHPPGWPPPGPRRPRRGRRVLRWAAALIAMVAAVAIIAFTALMVLTPSAGNAGQLAAEQARAHGAVYPGPPVPRKFAASLVATEDKRFYSEPGVDLYAFARVGGGYLTGGRFEGGATLYQQLAKMLYTGGQSSPSNEPEQVALAIKLDFSYPKKQILQMYAGIVYFGHGYYGLAAASCGYFGVRPAGLSWAEAAMLAGLVQGPSLDDPLRHPAAARARQAHVLSRLVATGVLSPARAAAAQSVPLDAMLSHGGNTHGGNTHGGKTLCGAVSQSASG